MRSRKTTPLRTELPKLFLNNSLRTTNRPIGVATYTVVPQLPEAYRHELPSPEAIAERMRLWDRKENDDELLKEPQQP